MSTDKKDKVHGVAGFYIAAFLALLMSADTSWRFFRDELGITDDHERIVMFLVLEVGLLACAYGMRANVKLHGRPGAPRLFAWLLCAVSGYMAWQLSGVGEGIARVTLGPIMGLWFLHLALGIEIRAGSHASTIWSQLRERLLSRLGLATDDRDALTHTRDRAARRAARLALAEPGPLRTARLRRALDVSGVAEDPVRLSAMLARLAVLQHAHGLADLDLPSPWHRDTPSGTGTGLVTEPLRQDQAVSVPSSPRTKRGPSAKSSAKSKSGAGASAKSGTDHVDLIRRIRDHERDGAKMPRRRVMAEFRVGSATASELLHAARNGQVT